MSDWHGYLLIENLGLNNNQRTTLINEIRQLGPRVHPSPACLNHWRTRLDNQAAIFEALFDTNHLTIQAMKRRLANIFNVLEEDITHTYEEISYSPGNKSDKVELYYKGNEKIRFILFGTMTGTYEQSWYEVMGYLKLNEATWQVPE